MKALETDETLRIQTVINNWKKGILLEEFSGIMAFYLKAKLTGSEQDS